MNFLSTQWSTDGSTSSEPMGLCIISIVKTLADNHTLDDRNHQGHHTTLLQSETVVHSPSKSVRQRSQELRINRGIKDSTWSTERGRQGPPVVPASWCHPPHLKRIIGMATAAFPWPTDQPRVWPAVVAAFTGLEPRDFCMWGCLKDRVHGNNLQTMPNLKAAITTAIRAIPRKECGRVIENYAPRIQMCLQRRRAHLEHFLSAPVTQRVFVVQTWNFGDVCFTGFT